MANLKYKWDDKCICNNQRIKRIKYEFIQTTNNIQSSWGKVYKYYCSNCKGLIGWQKIGGKKLKKIGDNRNVRYRYSKKI